MKNGFSQNKTSIDRRGGCPFISPRWFIFLLSLFLSLFASLFIINNDSEVAAASAPKILRSIDAYYILH